MAGQKTEKRLFDARGNRRGRLMPPKQAQIHKDVVRQCMSTLDGITAGDLRNAAILIECESVHVFESMRASLRHLIDGGVV